MNNIAIQYYNSPVGEMVIGSYDNQLCLCDWRYRKMRIIIDQRLCKGLNSEFSEQPTPVTIEAVGQLKEYFAGQRHSFDLPLLLVGSEFQNQVWREIEKINYGQTATYGQLAQKMKKPKALRAVAGASGANAISILIPCHRIIGSDGKLVGYAGGLEVKQKLLDLEDRSQLELF
ncbi:MAG: methylated-DNA--[protein]-cysteine S-methyltransferase [Candidatus Marinimicrobia bacterium]|nr:methylated-DNA--[protein]-cysteine S-methyltransferase [Candidatus Neomarinimicrobiota bacterium]